MQFKSFFLPCLAHASYLVGDGGECAIVDPQRDVGHYLAEAAARGLRITHVIETHLHADFVSGHLELARATGATIHVSHKAGAGFDHEPLREGDEIRMGDVVLRVMETPGHTPESLCLLVIDRARGDQPVSVLTGDTLFIGDVGRPDLAGSRGYTSEQMAALLYDSLRNRLMPLADEVEVFPAHGAGSSCGRKMSAELFSTIGRQKQLNWALQPQSREDFVVALTAGLDEPPMYFPRDAELNRQGAPALDDLAPPSALGPDQVAEAMQRGAVLLDVRPATEFTAGFVPGSTWVGLNGSFASWCGSLIPAGPPVILVPGSPGDVESAALRLGRVGLSARGFLDGGVQAWVDAGRELSTLDWIDVDALAARRAVPVADDEPGGAALELLDVRQPGEWEDGHVPGAVNVPLRSLAGRIAGLEASRPLAVVCQTGYRSTIAASLLAAAGFRSVLDVTGGTAAWIEAGRPVESPVTH